MFVTSQVAGAVVAVGLIRMVYPQVGEVADRVVVPRDPVESPNGG
jgi:hypothetical protein